MSPDQFRHHLDLGGIGWIDAGDQVVHHVRGDLGAMTDQQDGDLLLLGLDQDGLVRIESSGQDET